MADPQPNRAPVARLPRIRGMSVSVTKCERCGDRFERYWIPGSPAPVFCEICEATRLVEKSRLETEKIAEQSRRDLLALHGSVDHPAHLVPSSLGALNELRACVDLMTRGFHVFRAQSPSCPCDLIAMRESVCYRVEVRTARRSKNGRLLYPPRNPSKSDTLACVLPDGVVVYIPDIYPTGTLGSGG